MQYRNRPLEYYGKTPKKIGDGTYSRVYKYKARKRRAVAVKIHNNSTAFIREITLMDECRECPYIVDMVDVGYDSKRGKFYHVMPLAENDLYNQIGSGFFNKNPEKVKVCIYQLLQALSFIHVKKYLHRDIKAENILAFRENNGNVIYRLCDFGLSRKCGRGMCYTSYMVTLYYRPPENLLDRCDYTSAIDVWSAGCILVELILGSPPFDFNENKEVLDKQLTSLGSNIDDEAPEYIKEAVYPISKEKMEKGQLWWNTCVRTPILESKHAEALDLIEKMLVIDPYKRISVREALRHPYFDTFSPISFPIIPIFRVYKPEDWSGKQKHIDWSDVKDSLMKIQDFLENVEMSEVIFVKTAFLFNFFANRDETDHLTKKNVYSYMLVISRVVSKLCCTDPISLNQVSKFVIKSKAKERTRYFLNKIGFKPNIYTGYDWLLEPRNVFELRSRTTESEEEIEPKVWSKLFEEIQKSYISSLFSEKDFHDRDPEEIVEECYNSTLKALELSRSREPV